MSNRYKHTSSIEGDVKPFTPVDRIGGIIKSWFAKPNTWYGTEKHTVLRNLFIKEGEGVSIPKGEMTYVNVASISFGDALDEHGFIYNLGRTHSEVYNARTQENFMHYTHPDYLSIALEAINTELNVFGSGLEINNLSVQHKAILQHFISLYLLRIRPLE